MPKIIENKLIEAFKEQSSFDRDQLFQFYLDLEPDLKESTFSWRIYDLKKKDDANEELLERVAKLLASWNPTEMDK